MAAIEYRCTTNASTATDRCGTASGIASAAGGILARSAHSNSSNFTKNNCYRTFYNRRKWNLELMTTLVIISTVLFDIVNSNCGIHVMASRSLSGVVEIEDRRTLLLRNFLRVNQLRRRIKRESAFDLLKLESQLDMRDAQAQRKAVGQPTDGGGGLSGVRRDDTINDEKCQAACNDRLRSGLDMVKAHSAFGSVGVPSVLDELDLQMFCRLDSAHDRCLRECGFEIHFNMRDYVCRERMTEMVSNLACYERSAAHLKRKCGAHRCGPYTELEVSLVGFAQRCRTLLCDLNCTQGVLVAQCGREPGLRAAKFLTDYSRVQISTWMRDMAKSLEKPIAQIIPPSCSRLFCERFDAQNCTSIVDTPSNERQFATASTVRPLPASSTTSSAPPTLSTTNTPPSSATRSSAQTLAHPQFFAFGPPSIPQLSPPIPPPFPFKAKLSDTVLTQQQGRV